MLILRLRINTLSSMKKFSVIITLSIALLTLVNSLSAQNNGYKIDIKINGLSNSKLILGNYFASSMYPVDTVVLDQSGFGIFEGNKVLTQGMYIVYFEDGTYFEIMMGADQEFSVETDTGKYVEKLKIKGSPDNEIFSGFQNYMMRKQTELKSLQSKIENTEDKEEKEKLTKEVLALGQERIEKINSICNENPDLFVSVFLKATLDIVVPEELKEDPQLSYNYYKQHYFDNFDLSDVRLLHTPLYEDKMLNYLDKIVVQAPDTLIKEIDMIVEKAESDSAIFRYVLITLFSKYGKSQYMGMDAVQVHIAEKYYIPHSWWSDKKYIDDLEERVEVLKPLLIGKTAPDIELRHVPAEHFKQAANDTALKNYPHAGSFFHISDIDAEFTVLYFWEATCSHCKKSTPKLYEIYQDTLKQQGVQVVAISTLFGEDGKTKWIDFINKNECYDWINAWNPYSYKYKETYDVKTTPQLFLLNKDKEIIGKKLGVENVADLINAYKKHN